MHDRSRRPRRILATVIALIATAALVLGPLAATSAGAFAVTVPTVLSGLASPTQVTNAGDGTDRLFVTEARGTVRVIRNGALQPGYFMDIRSKVEHGGERGLLGLAFDPDFVTNRRLFVFYTRNGGDIVVARYRTNAARTAVVASTASPLLLIEHSAASNHNGGGMAFGPNGYLYIAVGDGGGSGDPGNDAQEKSGNFLGKILRINTDGAGAGTFDRYSVPRSNPFYGSTPGRAEVWAYGLRNPWRISFDRGTGKLFIGDVGQGRYEEVDREAPGLKGGRNYGWSVMEGFHCYKLSRCPLAGDTLPILEYSHARGNCSITGGYVYRGPSQTALVGQYVFADFCSGRIWTVPHDGRTKTLRADTSRSITSFGEAEDGELYAVTADGKLVRILAS